MSPGSRILPIADRALDLSLVGYTRVGFALRRLEGDPAPAGGLEGKSALVTGASSGLGEAAALALARAGAEVHIAARDLERGAAARERIAAAAPGAAGRLHLELFDVSELGEVRRFAEHFVATRRRLDVLVHNAGVLAERRERTSDGVELTFATNVLGPFALTRLLLPALRAAAPSRVITVSSGGMYTASLDARDPQLEDAEFDGPRFYAHTKRAQVALNRAWSERHSHEGIAFHAMHPGWADTPGLRRSLPRFRRALRPLLRDARQGADTIAWLAAAPALDPPSGGFWHDRVPRSEHRVPWTRESEADRERLWSYCERLSQAGPQAGA